MLRIPRFARVWASTGLSSKWKSKIWKQVLYLTLFISLIVMLFRPQPLLIEAEGALMPLESKSIFATSEGFVSELLVNEDQHVQEGQVLLRLRSPSLELQQEELAGQFRTLDEEAKSLRISINQIDPTANDVLNQQSTLAAKLNDIQIQQESLQKQLTIIEGQIKGLELKSPISGTVVGRDLRQSLQGRPVNRGDLLFKVMDLQNEWEARLQVRDRDSDYVLRWYHPNASDDDRTFQLLIDSAPQKKFESIVTAVANRVSNLHREGCFLEVHATIKDLTAEERRVGSSVRAYFNCGEEPTWFVWTRPLIEAARRKLWF